MNTFTPRRAPATVPVYSLTGDLVNYTRCPYQYRLFTRTGVRESHPAQRWYGQFLHRGMRLAYDQWNESSIQPAEFEWHGTSGNERFQSLVDEVVRSLRAEGLFRPGNTQDLAARRLLRAIRLLGSELFPLVKESEVRLNAVRECDSAPFGLYQMTGVIDVLAVANFGKPGTNALVDVMGELLEDSGYALGEVGEVVVDYKGVTRERLDASGLDIARSQVLTYAWLRNREEGTDIVQAGVLCLVDELLPDGADPNYTPTGTEAREMLRRSIEIVPVSKTLTDKGTAVFDSTVAEIEEALKAEVDEDLPSVWVPRPERRTCTACDAKWHCPESDLEGAGQLQRPVAPSAP